MAFEQVFIISHTVTLVTEIEYIYRIFGFDCIGDCNFDIDSFYSRRKSVRVDSSHRIFGIVNMFIGLSNILGNLTSSNQINSDRFESNQVSEFLWIL